MSRWAILCPGPSLNRVKRIHADEGRVVAVNGAIVSPFVVSAWVLMDIEALASCYYAMRAWRRLDVCTHTTLWTPERFIEDIGAKRVPDEVARFYALCLVRDWPSTPREALREQMPGWCNQLDWRESSFLVAIALIILRDPDVRAIRCYGVDWKGSTYHVSEVANERTRLTEKRFALERKLYERVTDLLWRRHIQLSRVIEHEPSQRRERQVRTSVA